MLLRDHRHRREAETKERRSTRREQGGPRTRRRSRFNEGTGTFLRYLWGRPCFLNPAPHRRHPPPSNSRVSERPQERTSVDLTLCTQHPRVVSVYLYIKFFERHGTNLSCSSHTQENFRYTMFFEGHNTK